VNTGIKRLKSPFLGLSQELLIREKAATPVCLAIPSVQHAGTVEQHDPHRCLVLELLLSVAEPPRLSNRYFDNER
jgi:hypothetical protein